MMMITISRAMCSSSSTTINTDHLRSQLDQLHSEAEITRRKAKSARFRFLRLSEAAENLCRQAAVSVRKGKEEDARELLYQKKKIMSALEKSKGRVELFDELAAKLNEAISIKEAQLVRNLVSDLEVDGDNADGPVRIVSPARDNSLNGGNNLTLNQSDVSEEQNVVPDIDSEGNLLSCSEAEEAVPKSISSGNEKAMFSSFRDPLSYADILEDLDQQLTTIENHLMTIIENEEKLNDSKVQQLEILENIHGARMRIRNYVQELVGTR